MRKPYTVNDMYNLSSENNEPLLTSYPSVFWQAYIAEHDRYDKMFRRLFRYFKPFWQDEDMTIEEVTAEFSDEVYNHLMANDKKYSELYRVEIVDDDSFSIVDNYKLKEEMIGKKEETNNDTYGATANTKTETLGAKTDTETDTKKEKYGSKTDTESNTKDDTSTYNQGQQSNNSTNKVAPYDSENFYNDRNILDNVGAREDSSTVKTTENINKTLGGQENTITNTIDKNIGAQENSVTENLGSHIDEHTKNNNESYTLNRSGNIGVMTTADIMQKHVDFWDGWTFYQYIFKQIASELLIV